MNIPIIAFIVVFMLLFAWIAERDYAGYRALKRLNPDETIPSSAMVNSILGRLAATRDETGKYTIKRVRRHKPAKN